MKLIGAFVIGTSVFLASFVIFWFNEGRLDLSKVARGSKIVGADTIAEGQKGGLVSVTGSLSSRERIVDPLYGFGGDYIQLVRSVEMFSWEERSASRESSRDSEGRRRYSYRRVWTEEPADSDRFQRPSGHTNPPLPLSSKTFTAKTASIGVYLVDPPGLRLPEPVKLSLPPDLVAGAQGTIVRGDVIFRGAGTYDQPQIGDVRIGYHGVESDRRATVFGKLAGDRIVPFFYKGKHRLYRAIEGERDEGIAKMAMEHKAITWALRFLGFVAMWLGLWLFLGPVNAVLNLVPVLGSVGRLFVGFVSFFVALALSTLVILVSVIGHNLVGLVLVLMAGTGAVLLRRSRATPQ